MNLQSTIHILSIIFLPLMFAITLHEAAHGLIAKWLGDRTALMLGRVSLNPAKHVDPVGTIIVPVLVFLATHFVFGWAKPVPVNYRNLRNPKRDMGLVALAGPVSNLLQAFVWALVARIALTYFDPAQTTSVAAYFLFAGCYGVFINGIFCLLNLVPIPPLDGGRILMSLLPDKLSYRLALLEPFGMWIVLALLLTGILGSILWPYLVMLCYWLGALFGVPILQVVQSLM